jgi:hypothetical protein
MHHLEERELILEQLSNWLLHTGALPVWRGVFLAEGRRQVLFAQETITALFSQYPLDWTTERARAFSMNAGGRLSPMAAGELFVAFDSPAAALRAALELQREERARPLRMGIASGRFACADVRYGSKTHRVYYGDEVDRIRAMVQSCVPGTLQLCPDTYRAVQRVVSMEVPQTLVTTELVGAEVVAASITLPPPDNAYLSSFAGLGLV